MSSTGTAPTQVSNGLLLDRYELMMLSSFVADGTVDRRSVYEAFPRRLPAGRRYGMVAGTARLLALIEDFRYDRDEIEWFLAEAMINDQTADYLGTFRFHSDIYGLREGDVFFPGTPPLTVVATRGEGLILETLDLSVLNHDCAVASAAARMVCAAGGRAEDGGRPIVEMGSRRVHEHAAIAAARAAYIAGFDSTSNVAAGRLYGIPTAGTASHAFTLAHDTEIEAFRSQIATHGVGTTLLVDTYDTAQGIRNAVAVAREFGAAGPGAIRIDSGDDLGEQARIARLLLDELGAFITQIRLTSSLDEFIMTTLREDPADGYGAGTEVVTGSGHPTAGMVYKLVSNEGADGKMRPVAKTAHGKVSIGGRKHVWRSWDANGTLVAETHGIDNATVVLDANLTHRLAQVKLMEDGHTVHNPSIHEIRDYAASVLASLPAGALDVVDGEPAIIPTVVTEPAAPAADLGPSSRPALLEIERRLEDLVQVHQTEPVEAVLRQDLRTALAETTQES